MNKLVRGLGAFVWVVSLTCTVIGQSGKAIYENDFEKTGLNKVPDDFLVLDGQFAVREEGGNRFLELPGAPLDTFGVLFGPTEKEGVVVSGRIFGTGKGRRYPTFALGLNGQGTSAYKLQVTPAKKALELFKGDEVKASVPYEWNSGAWTRLRLQVRKVKEGEWRVEGKVWTDKEPSAWMVSVDEKEQPVAGRASIWGSPYATTPIRFDDLLVISAKEKP
ncbi:MAG: hypothetical protein DME19_11225 [Verrucomicrobia bacterium]|nr:MAG: hypothetical protein DME19_11225 [Verrucomicrobiota bacterium]